MRDGDAVTAAVNAFADAAGRFDILVNNAGTGDLRPMHTVDDKVWHRLIDVNLSGTFNGMRAAIPLLLAGGGGAIVNNASVSGMNPTRNEAAYSAAKAGVIALTKSGALEYGPTVRVNCVAPGHVRTPLTAPVWEHFPDVFDPARESLPAAARRRSLRDRRSHLVPRVRTIELHHRPDDRGRRRRHPPAGGHGPGAARAVPATVLIQYSVLPAD